VLFGQALKASDVFQRFDQPQSDAGEKVFDEVAVGVANDVAAPVLLGVGACPQPFVAKLDAVLVQVASHGLEDKVNGNRAVST